MSTVGRAHALLAQLAPDVCLEVLAQGPARQDARLAATAAECMRSRAGACLTRELTLWLLMAMILWRHLSIPNVLAQLLSSQPWGRFLGPRPVTEGAIAHARERLGVEPLRFFFREQGVRVQPPATFHGLRVWAGDGMKTYVPDTPQNVAAFGRPSAKEGTLPFPQMLLLTLTSVHCHGIRDARLLPYHTDERDGMAEMVLAHLSPLDLFLGDRGLYAAWFARDLSEKGVHWLLRLPSSVQPRLLKRRGPGDFDVEICREKYQREGPDGQRLGPVQTIRFRARMIVYQVEGSDEEVRLLTDQIDPAITSRELAELYHARWEVEIGYDEVETHLMATLRGSSATTFRGRSPEMVGQEVWAMLATYNLVRHLMNEAARHHRLSPRQLSFVDCVQVLCRWAQQPTPPLPPGARLTMGHTALRAAARRPRTVRAGPNETPAHLTAQKPTPQPLSHQGTRAALHPP
jgi:hypothetical protein